MSRRLHRWRPSLLAALLALAAQLTLGIAASDASLPTPEQQLAALLADPAALCHGDPGSGQPAPRRHANDCLLCPYCTASTAAALLGNDMPVLPMPRASPILVVIAAPHRARLPRPPLLAARPRGPPIPA